MATITDQDIDDLAVGAAVLGTGGGGDPYIGKLLAKAAIEQYGPVDLIALEDVPDGATVVACGAMGAPTILIEKSRPATRAIWRWSPMKIIPASMLMRSSPSRQAASIPWCRSSLPPRNVSRSLMLTAWAEPFRSSEMETFNVYGVPASPVAVADERGNRVLIETQDAAKAEWLARGVTIRMGGQAYIVNYGMDGRTTKRVSVPATMSLAIGIGRTLREAAAQHRNLVEALISYFSGTHYGYAEVITAGQG